MISLKDLAGWIKTGDLVKSTLHQEDKL